MPETIRLLALREDLETVLVNLHDDEDSHIKAGGWSHLLDLTNGLEIDGTPPLQMINWVADLAVLFDINRRAQSEAAMNDLVVATLARCLDLREATRIPFGKVAE